MPETTVATRAPDWTFITLRSGGALKTRWHIDTELTDERRTKFEWRMTMCGREIYSNEARNRTLNGRPAGTCATCERIARRQQAAS